MSTEENKELVRRWLVELIERRNVDSCDHFCAPEYVYHDTTGDLTLEQSKQLYTELLAAFPDFNYSIDDMIAEDDEVAVRCTVGGTHAGSFSGISPTGKKVTWGEMEINRFANGKCVESWVIPDILGLMQQLGVIPPVGGGG